jgi:hypothetical protein
MIKFFRKIRQNLLMENKTGKYLKYAIGEVVLVVIGILIALGINSSYQKAQSEQKIDAILVQMQEELSTDILDAHRIFSTRIYKDSLAKVIFNKDLTLEEFKSLPMWLTWSYVSFSNNTTSYDRLMQNIEEVPAAYASLLPHLHLMFVEIQNDIDDYNALIKKVVISASEHRMATQPWALDNALGIDTVSWAVHRFNDPYLRNKTSWYMNALRNISSSANDYRTQAIIVYKQIDSLLHVSRDSYPSHLQEIGPDPALFEDYLGAYTYTGSRLPAAYDELEIDVKNGHITIDLGDEQIKLWWHEGLDYYAFNKRSIYRFIENEQGQKTLEGRWFLGNEVWVKKD